MPLFRHFFLLKSMGSLERFVFSSRRPSLKVKVPSINVDWKDKFLFFRLSEASGFRSRWNLGKLSDRLDDTLIVPGFDILEGFGGHRVLSSYFFELTLVRAGMSSA